MVFLPRTNLLFATNSAELQPSAHATIQEIVTYMKTNPAFKVELEGFADTRGTQAHNLRLSTRRAQVVRDALIAAGVPKENIIVSAYGELNNANCAAKDATCLQQDRRVEVIVLPEVTETAASPKTK